MSNFCYCFECHWLSGKKTLQGGHKAFCDQHLPQVKLVSIGAWLMGIINIRGTGSLSVLGQWGSHSPETRMHRLLLPGWGTASAAGAVSMRARVRQRCFPPPCPLCEAQTSRGDTLLCIYRGKRRPDFISRRSLPLVLIYSFFSPLLFPQPWAWRWSQFTWEAAEWCGKIKPERLGSYYLGDA